VALEGYSDSHAKFFDHYYDRWTKGLSVFDVTPQFLWITPDRHDVKKHVACEHKFPEHNERYIHLEEVNGMIGRSTETLKQILDEARPTLAGCLTALGNITADRRSGQ
jgi:hypothetical protein